MRDEVFDLFISKFGEATDRVDVPPASIERYRGKLPEQLLQYWQQEGWCGYGNGLFWTVDPASYEDIVDEWLEDSPLEEIDAFHVFARTAFGTLYACGEKSGRNLSIVCAVHGISAVTKELRPKSAADRDLSIQVFFASHEPAECDLDDQNKKPLFERACKKLGPLKANEIYGFEPAIIAGGSMLLENLRKVDLDVHLTLLRQLAAPSLPFSQVDIDKLSARS